MRRVGLSLVENSETKLGILWSRHIVRGPESASNGEYEGRPRVPLPTGASPILLNPNRMLAHLQPWEGAQMAKLITIPGPPTSLNEGRHSCYIEPASLVEVMFDQLAWLLEHTSESCSPKCPHCARLEKVKDRKRLMNRSS